MALRRSGGSLANHDSCPRPRAAASTSRAAALLLALSPGTVDAVPCCGAPCLTSGLLEDRPSFELPELEPVELAREGRFPCRWPCCDVGPGPASSPGSPESANS